MLAEILGKGGHVCAHAAEGTIRCPLLVRPTSEDVITGHIMQVLGVINPRWWLPDLLNSGLGTTQFRRQVFRGLKIKLWENRPSLPIDCLPCPEGSTQVDAVLRWENPATTIYLEFKYLSPLSASTRNGPKQDQLLRNIRVGLHECGCYETQQLFPQVPRRFYLLVISPERGHLHCSRDVRTMLVLLRHGLQLSRRRNNLGRLQRRPPGYGEIRGSDL